MPNFSSINFLNNNKKIVISENGKLPELDGSLLKNIKKLDVNSYENVKKINFTNARLNADSTDGDVINVDTSMNVENESIDNLGNPLILRGNFIGNSENTVLLYTGDNTETVSNNITTFTNIALNKDYLGDVTSYNTSNILTYDNVPPIYGQNSEGHKSFGMDIYDKDMTIQYTNKFSEYVKVSYWYYISSTATIRSSVYFGLGSRNGAYYMGVFNYDVAYKTLRLFGPSDALKVPIETDKWHYVELCIKLDNYLNKAKAYHDGNYIGEEGNSAYWSSWNNTDGQILFRSITKDAFNFDQLMVNISSEEEYNNFENTEHPIPTSASEVIKSTSFVINDIDTVPEDGKLFIKSKNQTYTISPSLIGGGSSSLNVNEYQNIDTLSFPNAIVSQDAENTKKLIVKTQNIFKVLEFPSADMINNSIYVLASGETKAYFENEWINISPEIVETIDESATNNNIPTTLAVKNYINTQLESSIDLSNYYNKTESDEKFALKENTVSYTFTTENSLNTIPITNGQAVICEDSEKLYIDKTDTRISIGDLIIVEASTDLPEIPLNKLYFVKETDKLYIYSNNTWVSINPNQFIDPNRLLPSSAENGNLLQYYIETGDLVTPTGLNEASQQDGEDWTITYENYEDAQVGNYWYAIFDGDTQYNSKRTIFVLPVVIQWKSNKEKKILNKLRIYPTLTDSSGQYYVYSAPSTFKLLGSNDGQAWTTLLNVEQYRWPINDSYYYDITDIYNDWYFENNTGYLYYKLEITEATNRGYVFQDSFIYINEIEGYGENRGWRLISVDDIKSDIALDLSNYQQENNISIASTNGSISLSGTDFVINGNTSNTSGGLAIVEDSGKLPTSIIPESTVDLSNYHGGFKVITDEAEGPILIQGSPITLLGYELTLQSTHGNMILNTGYDIDIDARVCDIYGTYIKLSTSQNSLTFNGAELNTPGGLAVIEDSGKLPSSIIPETDTSPKWTKTVLNQTDFSSADESYGGSYKELDGICSVEVYDADGFKVEFDIKCDFTGNKTRIYIPNSLATETISNWTMLYLQKTIV